MTLLAGVAALAGVAEIRTIYHEINTLVESKAAKRVSVYAAGVQGRVEWRTVTTRIEQDEFDKSDWRAQVYLHENKVVKVQFDTTSQSGDWKLTEEYYFYKNGRTAFYLQTLLTFQGYDYEHDRELPPGPYVAEERVYFDEGGRKIRRLFKAFVQKTEERVDGSYLATGPMGREILPNIAALPFYGLMEKR
jgi:hypothetical protein